MAELTPKVISELPDSSVPQDADLFAISRSGSSRSISWSTLKSGLPSLENLKSTQHTISSGSYVDISISNGESGFVVVTGSGGSSIGNRNILIYQCSSSGIVSNTIVLDGTNITVSNPSTGVLRISNGASVTAYAIRIYY